MPRKQPRRNPKNTAGAFEALFFPELVDRIFDFAPCQALLVLRAVCQSWKYRADCRLVGHVIVSNVGKYYSNRWTATTPYGPIPHRNWHKTKITKHVTHVDILGNYQPAWVKKLPQLKAMRHAGYTFGPVKTYYPPTPGSPLVLPPNSHLSIHAVICFLASTGAYQNAQFPGGGNYLPKSLTLLIWALPSEAGSKCALSECTSNYSFISLVATVVNHFSAVYTTGVSSPLTVVNLSVWYDALVCQPNRFNPEGPPRSHVYFVQPAGPAAAGQRWGCQSIHEFCTQLRQALRLSDVPLHQHDELIGTISFSSLDDYRHKVGEERLRFETELVGCA